MKSCCHCLHFSCWEEPLQHSQAILDLGNTVCLPAHSRMLSSSPNSHLFHSLLILAALAPQPPTPKLLTHILSPHTTSFWPGSLQSASLLSVAQPEPAGAGSQAPKPCVKSLQGVMLPKDAFSLGNMLRAGAVLSPQTQTLSLLPPALWCPSGAAKESVLVPLMPSCTLRPWCGLC